MNRTPNDPNKGMNTKYYLLAVLVAFVLMVATAVMVLGKGRNKIVPHAVPLKPTTAASPQ